MRLAAPRRLGLRIKGPEALGVRSSVSGELADPKRLAGGASRQGARCDLEEETRKAQVARYAYPRRGCRPESGDDAGVAAEPMKKSIFKKGGGGAGDTQ